MPLSSKVFTFFCGLITVDDVRCPAKDCMYKCVYIYMDLSANRLPSDPSVYDSLPEVVCSADKIPWNLVAVTQIIHVWDMYAQSMPDFFSHN